jgi:hypothetical protein
MPLVRPVPLQLDPSGALPFPCRIGRDDVAALCVAAADADADGSGVLPTDQSTCRWYDKFNLGKLILVATCIDEISQA